MRFGAPRLDDEQPCQVRHHERLQRAVGVLLLDGVVVGGALVGGPVHGEELRHTLGAEVAGKHVEVDRLRRRRESRAEEGRGADVG